MRGLLIKPNSTATIYGVKITKSNSSPTHLVYTDDAVGLSPSTMSPSGVLTDNGWESRLEAIVGMKPCTLQGGTVNYYLDKNDYTKKSDGVTNSVLTGADGDIMVEYKKCYISITSDDDSIYIRLSDTKVDDTFSDWPFSYHGLVRPKFYVGAYIGYVNNGALYSISGITPTVGQTISTFIANAHARGEGYEIVPLNKLILLQVLYLIRFKSLDSQTALGLGYTSGEDMVVTGGTNAQKMCYGTSNGLIQVKVNGIEDFWGNLYWIIDGLFCDTSGNIKVGDTDFVSASNGDDYVTSATMDTNVNGYTSDIHATNELGFLVKTASGSDSTYYCDNGHCNKGCIGGFGGHYGCGLSGGFCFLYVYFFRSNGSTGAGARLAWCGD